MLPREKCTIVIPVYSEKLSDNERISFIRCLDVFQKYSINLISPKKLNTKYYESLARTYQSNLSIIRFNSKYFKSALSYNRLLMKLSFYRNFQKSEYILIYHLDAYVFNDELEYWCNKGYDYIGAPWFDGFWSSHPESKLIAVGNGGFSLRKVDSALRALKSFRSVRSYKEYLDHWKSMNWKGRLVHSIPFIFSYLFLNKFNTVFNDFPGNEDLFWGIYVSKKLKWFSVSPIKEALAFSFEMHPEKCFELNGHKFPFGCHGWWKYGHDFWSNKINI